MFELRLERAGARVSVAGAALSLFVCATPARAQDAPDGGVPPAETITIVEPPPAEAASSVHFSSEELRARPHQTPSDLLRQTPGLLVGQHAGGGKADQLFLRGFDADHGTDVAVFVDDIPVNLTSHGHGQGYADSHWIIPETIRGVDVHKGPYGARFGDFYTAGAIDMTTIDRVDGLQVSLSGGTQLTGPVAFENPSYRLVALASPELSDGSALLATEISFADGPFVNPQEFRRGIAFAKWRGRIGNGELRFTTNLYGARWNQSGQVPAREVEAGRLDRFGSVDPTEGGEASRASVALGYENGPLAMNVYGVLSRLRLYSNFTLYARDAENGDQIEQTDARTLYGLNGRYVRGQRWGSVFGIMTAGVQLRADDIDADLWHTSRRRRVASCFEQGNNPCNRVTSRVRDLAAYVEEDLQVTPWLQLIGGLRYDLFIWDVEDRDDETVLGEATTGGTAQRAMVSPKLSLVLRPHRAVELFVNGGFGFHSNDARAAVASRGDGALARAIGAEVGARVRPLPQLGASVAAWTLYLESEQVWSGDNGGTEASDSTRRIGLDADVTWRPLPWLTLDANVALARSRFVANRGNAGGLALAPKLIGGGGATVRHGPAMVALRARGVGDRDANDEGTLTADGFFVMDLVAAYTVTPRLELGVTAYNLTNQEWREAQFAEESRLPDEPAPVEDVHFTPGAPLTVLGTVSLRY